jgi:hypothetical protein
MSERWISSISMLIRAIRVEGISGSLDAEIASRATASIGPPSASASTVSTTSRAFSRSRAIRSSGSASAGSVKALAFLRISASRGLSFSRWATLAAIHSVRGRRGFSRSSTFRWRRTSEMLGEAPSSSSLAST